MSVKKEIRTALEAEEAASVSDSFGGTPLPGRTPSFSVSNMVSALIDSTARYPTDEVSQLVGTLGSQLAAKEFRYAISASIRFAFLIELTNLKITSTKMKTRWLPGSITKTRPGSFTNYRGQFAPGADQRAAEYDACYDVFKNVLTHLIAAPAHAAVVQSLSGSKNGGVAYEFVFTYADPAKDPVHAGSNVRLADLQDLKWLISARTTFRSLLPQNSRDKIRTKTYLTDRAQTGTDQTNRAKRWEILSTDFQHATLEQCWSVERKLLTDLAKFEGFPEATRVQLVEADLCAATEQIARCPITLHPLNYAEFVASSGHGESRFQVGHLKPLKIGGRHDGANVSWISEDGNRIQGDLELHQVRELITGIAERISALNPH